MLSEKSGDGRALASKSAQSSTDFKDIQDQIKQQTTLLESLRNRQEACRKVVLDLAAVERRQVLNSSLVVDDGSNPKYPL